jgi:hypothetical protein
MGNYLVLSFRKNILCVLACALVKNAEFLPRFNFGEAQVTPFLKHLDTIYIFLYPPPKICRLIIKLN